MSDELLYDFAISYASGNEEFVSKTVEARKSRGLSVFFAPDHQARMVGNELHSELVATFASHSRFCFVFASAFYAKSEWTMKVELPAVLERGPARNTLRDSHSAR